MCFPPPHRQNASNRSVYLPGGCCCLLLAGRQAGRQQDSTTKTTNKINQAESIARKAHAPLDLDTAPVTRDVFRFLT